MPKEQESVANKIKRIEEDRQFDLVMEQRLVVHIEFLYELICKQLSDNLPDKAKIEKAIDALRVMGETLTHIRK